MPIAKATFPTAHASRYLQQLCKHFAHKVDAEYTPEAGSAALPGGHLMLSAQNDELIVEIRSDEPKELVKARYILEEHLVRFAFRERLLGLHWQYEP
ncbi:MAG: DUF2218 domain-containing protein [Pseudomonadota bacterium]